MNPIILLDWSLSSLAGNAPGPVQIGLVGYVGLFLDRRYKF